MLCFYAVKESYMPQFKKNLVEKCKRLKLNFQLIKRKVLETKSILCNFGWYLIEEFKPHNIK